MRLSLIRRIWHRDSEAELRETLHKGMLEQHIVASKDDS